MNTILKKAFKSTQKACLFFQNYMEVDVIYMKYINLERLCFLGFFFATLRSRNRTTHGCRDDTHFR